MATVRFSEQLRDAIRRKASNMFSDKIEAAEASFPKPILEGVMTEFLGADTIQKAQQLPDGLIGWAKQIDFKFYNGPQGMVRLDVAQRSIPDPASVIKSELGRYEKSYRSIPDMRLNGENPKWATIKQEWEAWRQRINAANEKRNEFVSMVNKLLEAHATLAPALKTWPALWDLLPEETKEKHKKISDRKSRKAEQDGLLESVDLDKLTATVTVNKLSGRAH